MCKGIHYCNICKRKYVCIVQTQKSFGIGDCKDDFESYCDPCQFMRLDEIEEDLRSLGRI